MCSICISPCKGGRKLQCDTIKALHPHITPLQAKFEKELGQKFKQDLETSEATMLLGLFKMNHFA